MSTQNRERSTLGRGHSEEVVSGERFEFGKNWSRFLAVLNEPRIATAVESLRQMLEVESLHGKLFLDAGSGSGLFSLAARRLGATVHSFDYDPQSVACTAELKRRYFPGDASWIIQEGSVLDRQFLSTLGTFDIVYSWGVLHHTGAMWSALENITLPVAANGRLFLAIYNDQGTRSRRWTAVKRMYNGSPGYLRPAILIPALFLIWGRPLIKDLLQGRPFRSWREYRQTRGMSPWHDLTDWIGGYPFEVAKPEQIFEFFRNRGYHLEKLVTAGGSLGCNQFVFQKAGGRINLEPAQDAPETGK